MKVEEAKIPNRFYYCAPEGIIPRDQVPHYAGLLEIEWDNTARVVKKAPLLHHGEIDYRGKLLTKFYYKCINLENEVKSLKRQLQHQ
jgi:hypothetical protein